MKEAVVMCIKCWQRGRRERNMWKWYALLSAFCSALTAVLAKMGVRDVNADLACAVRVSFVLFPVWGIAIAGGKTRELLHITPNALLRLFLSAVATGLSCFFISVPCRTMMPAKWRPAGQAQRAFYAIFAQAADCCHRCEADSFRQETCPVESVATAP